MIDFPCFLFAFLFIYILQFFYAIQFFFIFFFVDVIKLTLSQDSLYFPTSNELFRTLRKQEDFSFILSKKYTLILIHKHSLWFNIFHYISLAAK